MVRDSRWCHYLPGTSRRAPGSWSLPVSLLLPVRRDGWLVQAEAELCVGTACWVPRPRWCENSTQFCSNLLPLQSNHGRGHSHSHFLFFFLLLSRLSGRWLVVGSRDTRKRLLLLLSLFFWLFRVWKQPWLLFFVDLWLCDCHYRRPAGLIHPYTPAWRKRLRPNWSHSPASSKTESRAYGSAPFQVRRRPTGRPDAGHTGHTVYGRLTFFLPSRGQEVMLSAPARLRASAPLCRRPRASWRLRCRPPPLPLWTVWVLHPPPPPPPPRPLPRPSRTTPAWPSSSPCSRRAGRRSSSGDHPVRRVAARYSSSSSSKQIHILYTWVQTNIDIEVSGYILFILFRNLISTLECFSLWECCEIVSGCKKRPFSLFVAKFEINCIF